VVRDACVEAFDGPTFERLAPALRWRLASERALAEGVLGEQVAGAPPTSAAELISLMRGA